MTKHKLHSRQRKKGKEQVESKAVYTQYMYSYPHKTAYRKLTDIVFEDYKQYLQGRENSLYFHIPFCESKCGYCNLFSVVGQKMEDTDRYLDAMEEQIRQYHLEDVSFLDLTVGGGTPLLLEEEQLERLFCMAERGVQWTREQFPVVIETSPNQTTKEKLAILKQHHVSRISIGVQSFKDGELKQLNRRHTADRAKKAIEQIKREDFPCMNLDLIYGIPGQTKETVLQSLREALAYEPEELFVYPLYIKQGTYLAAHKERSSMLSPAHASVDEQHTLALYRSIRAYLQERDYVPYSMRRFVRRDCAKDVAVTACGFGNTVSIGCGGRSYIGNLHFCTPYSVSQPACRAVLAEYISTRDYTQITNGYLLNQDEEKRRYVIKNILFASGIAGEDYKKIFGTELTEDFALLEEWMKKGYLYEKDRHFYLTEEGFSLSDYLGPMLISEEVRERMASWKEGIC